MFSIGKRPSSKISQTFPENYYPTAGRFRMVEYLTIKSLRWHITPFHERNDAYGTLFISYGCYFWFFHVYMLYPPPPSPRPYPLPFLYRQIEELPKGPQSKKKKVYMSDRIPYALTFLTRYLYAERGNESHKVHHGIARILRNAYTKRMQRKLTKKLTKSCNVLSC